MNGGRQTGRVIRVWRCNGIWRVVGVYLVAWQVGGCDDVVGGVGFQKFHVTGVDSEKVRAGLAEREKERVSLPTQHTFPSAAYVWRCYFWSQLPTLPRNTLTRKHISRRGK